MKAIEENILAKYIFWGPDGAFEGTEMVLSPSMAQQARFILSTFSAKGGANFFKLFPGFFVLKKLL